MVNEIIEIVSSQGIWSLLSFILIYYILKQQEVRDKKQELREINYQNIISSLTNKFELIRDDIKEFKNKIET